AGVLITGDQVVEEGVIVSTNGEIDAVPISQGGSARAVGADGVALDDVMVGALAEQHAILAVAGNEVPHSAAAAADGITAGVVGDQDAGAPIRDGVGAVVVGADEVALHEVIVAADAFNRNAFPSVAGDQAPTDEVIVGPEDIHTKDIG